MPGMPVERAKVLITVKTYPTPSQHHVETVCVAGVRLDTPEPSWVRLYPIPFRSMGKGDQFAKWQIVDVDIRPRGSSDPRPESYSPVLTSIVLGDRVDSKKNWQKRAPLIAGLIGATSTCELIAANRAVTMADPAPSLGLIRPVDIDVSITEGKAWSKTQLQKVKKAAEPDLFNTPLAELRPAPFEIRYRYRCSSSRCGGHRQMVLDWELGVAGINWQRIYGAEARSRVLEAWTKMVDPSKDVHLFVGNQHQYRHSFSVLGIWYPKR